MTSNVNENTLDKENLDIAWVLYVKKGGEEEVLRNIQAVFGQTQDANVLYVEIYTSCVCSNNRSIVQKLICGKYWKQLEREKYIYSCSSKQDSIKP